MSSTSLHYGMIASSLAKMLANGEVADVTNFSERFTPEVEKAIPLAVGMVAKELASG